jgi:hypothetical protein
MSNSPYSTQYEEVLKKIQDKGSFSYDPSSDKLYQQYKDMAHKSGTLASKDAIGKASALTGGYGNSYASTVGGQTYNSYMQQADAVIPELYQLAYNQHNSELSNLYSQLSGYDKLKDNAPKYDPITLDAIAGAIANYQGFWNDESASKYDQGLTDYLSASNYNPYDMRNLVVKGQGWNRLDNGGGKAGKINDNAKISVGNTVFSMGELYDALTAAGMSKKDAKNYIVNLQKETGIE